MDRKICEEMDTPKVEIEMAMHGRPQKPVRTERGGDPPQDSDGFALRPCCVCEETMTLICPDCSRHLCCQLSCDREHLKVCAPVKRDVLSDHQM